MPDRPISAPPDSHSTVSAPTPVAEPRPTPLVACSDDTAITQASILEVLGRVGAGAPEHVLALLRRCHPDSVAYGAVLAWQQRLLAMSRQGLVHLAWCAVPEGGLRYYDRTLVRLTEAGRGRGARGGDKRAWLLGTIAHLSPDVGNDWLLEETIREAAFSHWSDGKHVRQWLKGGVAKGLLEIRPTRLAHRVPVLSLTRQGRAWLEQRAPGALAHVPRLARPAEAVMVHHLHMLRAAAWMLAASADDRALLFIQSDCDLAATVKGGRRSRRGDRYDKVPDGRMHMMVGGRRVTWDIEVIGNYRPGEIQQKYTALPKHTTYVAISDAVADRVAALRFPRPRVI